MSGCNNDNRANNDSNTAGDTSTTTQLSAIENYSYTGASDQVSVASGDKVVSLTKEGADLTAQTLASHQDNYIFSPYQRGRTLAMLAAGAGTGPANVTETIIDAKGNVIDPNTLRALVGESYGTKGGIEALHAAANSLDQKLRALNPSLDWQQKSALWGHEGYIFLTSYLDTLTKYYSPEMANLSYRSDAAGSTQVISDWISAATQNALTPFITYNGTPISDRTRLVSMNVETMNAEWPGLFDATQTTDERFKLLDGTVKAVPTMHTTGTFDTAETDQYLAYQLPIKNSTLALLVVMPKEGQFKTVQEQMGSSPLLEQITAALQPTNTTLHLPHFSIATYEESAIPSAGDEIHSDFSAVNGQGYLYLKQMAHMATIDVAEAGMVTRAAGMNVLDATKNEPVSVWDPSHSSGFSSVFFSQNIATGIACYYPPLLLPFMFVVRDTTTSTVLYAGVWSTPPGAGMAPDWLAYNGQSCEEALVNPGQPSNGVILVEPGLISYVDFEGVTHVIESAHYYPTEY